MSLDLMKIQEAAKRIAPYTVKTALVRLPSLDEVLGCRVYAKLECTQVTGSFKLRGAMNRALQLSRQDLDKGIVAMSSGNHGRGIAYAAKLLGAKATIVMPYTAPTLKVANVRALGAEVIQCDAADRPAVAAKVCAERGATMVPPYNDEDIMAGQGTIGLEILEQEPELDTVVVPISGGGLIGGISTAVKALKPSLRVVGAEPAILPRYTASLAAGHPVHVPMQTGVADALVSNCPGDVCFPYVQKNVDEIADVEDSYMLQAQKLLLLEGKIVAEVSSCIGMAAVLQGCLQVRPEEKVAFVISGGSVSAEQLAALLS